MIRHQSTAAVLACLGVLASFPHVAWGQLEDAFDDRVGYASSETELTLPPEIGRQDDRFTHVIEPGAMAAEIDSPPWHSNDLIAPMSFACPTDGYCDTPCPACRQARYTGRSVSLDALVVTNSRVRWNSGNRNAAIGSRLTLRNEQHDGSGIEFRFSGVRLPDQSYYSSFTNRASDHSRDLFQFDLDFYKRVWFGETNVTFSIGPRLSNLGGPTPRSGSAGSFLPLEWPSGNSSTAGGIGFGVAFDHPLYRSQISQLSVVGHARQSWLTTALELPTGGYSGDSFRRHEAGLGLEYRRQLSQGSLNLRAMWETQTGGFANTNGISLSVGYQW